MVVMLKRSKDAGSDRYVLRIKARWSFPLGFLSYVKIPRSMRKGGRDMVVPSVFEGFTISVEADGARIEGRDISKWSPMDTTFQVVHSEI
jgi:hypothetical protein